MVTVDHTLKGLQLQWRNSMNKFSAPDFLEFEVAKSFTKSAPCFLNRPLIKILEDLGVPKSVFIKHQQNAVEETYSIMESFKNASSILDIHGLGTAFKVGTLMTNIEKSLGLELSDLLIESELITDSLNYSVLHVLRELKTKARIPVPGSYLMVGVNLI